MSIEEKVAFSKRIKELGLLFADKDLMKENAANRVKKEVRFPSIISSEITSILENELVEQLYKSEVTTDLEKQEIEFSIYGLQKKLCEEMKTMPKFWDEVLGISGEAGIRKTIKGLPRICCTPDKKAPLPTIKETKEQAKELQKHLKEVRSILSKNNHLRMDASQALNEIFIDLAKQRLEGRPVLITRLKLATLPKLRPLFLAMLWR
jgi:hypothetical protein